MTTTAERINIYQKIGAVIMVRRNAIGLTADEIGSKAKVSRAQISNIELGKCGMSLHTLVGAANALRCKAWEILKDANI